MSLIFGKVVDKFKNPIKNASVGLMDKFFNDLYLTYTDTNGNYILDVENIEYPYFYAVKDYRINNLEFWCQNINLKKDLMINISLDKLEIYGLNTFKVHGAYNALMIYFRPMSLSNYLKNEKDLFPNLKKISIKINDISSKIYVKNIVEEFVGNNEVVKAYLLHVSIPKEGLKNKDNYLLVEIIDIENNLGQASIYFNSEK